MKSVKELAEIFKALSDPTRLQLYVMLSDCKCNSECINLCVNALTKRLDVTQSAVSQHLRVLRQAGLVNAERIGNQVHYSADRETYKMFREQIDSYLGSI